MGGTVCQPRGTADCPPTTSRERRGLASPPVSPSEGTSPADTSSWEHAAPRAGEDRPRGVSAQSVALCLSGPRRPIHTWSFMADFRHSVPRVRGPP